MKLEFVIDKAYDKKMALPMGFPKDKLNLFFNSQYRVLGGILKET